MSIPDKLREDTAAVHEGKSRKKTLRQLLNYFEQSRRGSVVNRRVEDALLDLDIHTVPDFRTININDVVHFRKGSSEVQLLKRSSTDHDIGSKGNLTQTPFTVNRFVSNEKKEHGIVSVKLQDKLERAIYLMDNHQYSQLPILSNDRKAEGYISWKSIGQAYAYGNTPTFVKDCMTGYHEVSVDASVTKLLVAIKEHECVLICGKDKSYITVFTAADLADMYEELAESFILVAEIEQHLRVILRRANFSKEDLKSVCSPDDDREINRIEDLTFAGYVGLFGNNERWERLQINTDRKGFCEDLNKVRELRNAVMHFDPDGLTTDQLKTLRLFCEMLRTLRRHMPEVEPAEE